MRRIIKLFDAGSVAVVGMKGRGKDTLVGNVIARRKKPYISNTYYGYDFNKLDYNDLRCGGNTWKNLAGLEPVKPFSWPYDDGMDVYIGDAGAIFPSWADADLNRRLPELPTHMAFSRQFGLSETHFNCQVLGRTWLKIREMADKYILCKNIRWLFGKIVIQEVYIYELAESCERSVPPFPGRWWMYGTDLMAYRLAKVKYQAMYGDIKKRTLVYWNKSKHDTRVFKKILEGVDPYEELCI